MVSRCLPAVALLLAGAAGAAPPPGTAGVVHFDGGVGVTAVRWGADGRLEVREASLGVAKPRPTLVALMQGEDLYAAVEDGDGQWHVVRHRPFREGASAVSLPWKGERPTALTARGGRVYVGSPGRVDVVDFTGAAPVFREGFRSEHESTSRKAVDAFAWSGDTLVAVDDIVTPKFAFVLDIAGGLPKHRLTTSLLAGANEHYEDAAAWGDTVVMTTRFLHRSGSGHRLVVMKLGETEPADDLRSRLAYLQGKALPPRLKQRALTEGGGHGPGGGRSTVLAGDRRTAWRGVAMPDARHAVICAEERGLLVIPVDLPEGRKGRTLDLGGPCAHLVHDGGALVALVKPRRGPAGLVVLRWDPGAAMPVVAGRFPLPGRPLRLADGRSGR